MKTEKVTVIVGNYNQGHQLELCIRSLMKYNKDYIERILIMDNQSDDYSLRFYVANPWRSITTIIKYDKPMERRQDVVVPRTSHYQIGMANVNTRFALVTHADAEFTGPCCEAMNDQLKLMPNLFLCGVGGGDPTDKNNIRKQDNCMLARIHEWCLFVDVNQYRDGAYSFNQEHIFGMNFDCSAFMYYRAWHEKKQMFILEPEEKYVKHLCLGGSAHNTKHEIYAKNKLSHEYGVKF